jgi:hypothetical protein
MGGLIQTGVFAHSVMNVVAKQDAMTIDENRNTSAVVNHADNWCQIYLVSPGDKIVPRLAVAADEVFS